MSAVFISYVREDLRAVSLLADILRKNGVEVWLDRDQLTPGQRWEHAIRNAIEGGAFFLSVYSRARQQRDYGYVNEELVLAIDQIRKRPSNKAWFIPVKIDDCEIEDRSIGGGESILSFQVCDLTTGKPAFASLLRTLGVMEPVTNLGVPLAPGVPSFVELKSGSITYDAIPGMPDHLGAVSFPVSGGWCTRNEDGNIHAYIETTAPFDTLQTINETLGLSSFHALSTDSEISSSTENPSEFSFERDYLLPMGTQVPNFQTGEMIALPIDVPINSQFRARGTVTDLCFTGGFDASITFRIPGQNTPIPMCGSFRIMFEAT